MSVWKQLLIVVVLCAAVGAAWMRLSPETATALGLTGPTGEQSGPSVRSGRGGFDRADRGPARVVTAEVTEAEAGDRLMAIGTAEAAKSVTLYSQATGIVAEVAFTAGEQVAAGDVLVRLEDAEQRLAVRQAEIGVQSAQDMVNRYDRLSQSQAISAVQAEEARAALATAENELAVAELALARRSLTAPFDGVMGFAEIETGDMLTSTTAIATIDDRRTLFVAFQVPERFAALIEPSKAVVATTAAYGNETFMGEVNATATRIDPTSRTLGVRAALPNDDDRLRPGMAFSVAVDFETPGHPSVPKVAVQWDRDGAYVWKVVDGRVQRTAVTIVARTAGAVLVDGDIGPRDSVVAEGLDGLRDGAEIAAVEQAPAAAARL